MIVKENPLRDLSRLMIWYPFRWIVRVLPVTSSFALFNFLGDMHFTFGNTRKRQLTENIRRGFPDIRPEAVLAVVRTYLRTHYVDRLHIFTYPKLKRRDEINKICEMEGLSLLDTALEDKKGAIIVLGHYGPIQLPLFCLGLLGYKLIQVGLPTDKGLSWIGKNVAFRLRCIYEKMIPAQILPADRFLRPLFKHLKNNGVVMMNIDPAGGGQWIGKMVWFHFLGHKIPFPLGAATLSVKTGAPILPLSIERLSGNRYRFRIHSPIHNGSPAEPMEVVSYLVRWYEDILVKDPGLWHFWDEYEPGKLIRDDFSESPATPEEMHPTPSDRSGP